MKTLDVQLSRIQLVLFDVDGVLTDGGLYYLGSGELAVRFHVRDGMGIAVARRAGLMVGLISGRDVPMVRQRAEELHLDEVHLGIADKAAVIEEILVRRKLAPEDLVFIGDDVIDLPAMATVGVGIAVADAHPDVIRQAAWVTAKAGGQGAVREVLDRILTLRALR